MANVAPSSTSGVPLISGGASANPSFGTAVVAGGGTGATSFTAYSVICAGTTGTGAFQNVSGVGTSGQVLTSQGASALPQWASIPFMGMLWNVVTSSTQTITNNEGYISNAASGGVAYTLPATSSVGDVFKISGLSGGSGWSIAQGSGQSIQFGSSTTTVGISGSLASTGNTDSIEVVCAVANTTYIVLNSVGNITVV